MPGTATRDSPTDSLPNQRWRFGLRSLITFSFFLSLPILVCKQLGWFAPAPPPTVSLLVATELIDIGEEISTENCKIVERCPLDVVPEGAVTDVASALGKLARARIVKGEIILDVRIVQELLGCPMIPRGDRVVAIRVQELGEFSSGDEVDVLWGKSGETSNRPKHVARKLRIYSINESESLVCFLVKPDDLESLLEFAQESKPEHRIILQHSPKHSD